MKIIHYTGVYAPAWQFGGPPRSVSSLCEGLAALGHEVRVLTTDAGLEGNAAAPNDREIERQGVRVRYHPSRRGFMGIASPALEAAVAAAVQDCDVLHITGVWQPTSRAAFRAARRAGKPYVCSPRGALGRYSFTQKAWKKWPYFWGVEKPGLRRAAALHYTSRMELEEGARLDIAAPAFVVPNSIDFSVWQADSARAAAWRQAHGIGRDEHVFLYTGRMHHKKGLDLLPAACAALPRDRAWRLVLVGFDEDGTGVTLQREFAAAGLAERLLVLGGVEASALSAIYSAADRFVFPSRHENFGNVVVEALACGCPVLLSDQVGCWHELADFDGVRVLPRDPVAWAAEMTRSLDHSAREAVVGPAELQARFSAVAVARAMAVEYGRIRR